MQSTTLKSWLSSLIPGIITAAIVFGPSKMTITSKMGAGYGASLLWVIVVAIFFMAVYTNMAARIGKASDVSFLQVIKKKWGSWVAVVIGMGIFLVTASFQAGNAIGVGVAMAELTGTGTSVWVVLFTCFGVGLLFFQSFYRILEKIMTWVVVLMLLSFLVTCLIVKPSFSDTLTGLIPSFPEGSMPLITAFVASCFSLVGALYQSYLVQQRARLAGVSARTMPDKSLFGILLLGVMSASVMLCAGAALHESGQRVDSAADMGKSLEPLFGGFSTFLFLFGLWGAAVSSLIGNAVLGGTLMSDSLGSGALIDRPLVKVFIGLIMVVGAVVAIMFGKLPLELIVFAQRVTIFIVPLIGFALFITANDKRLMGDLVNSVPQKIYGGLGLLLICVLAVHSFQSLF